MHSGIPLSIAEGEIADIEKPPPKTQFVMPL